MAFDVCYIAEQFLCVELDVSFVWSWMYNRLSLA